MTQLKPPDLPAPVYKLENRMAVTWAKWMDCSSCGRRAPANVEKDGVDCGECGHRQCQACVIWDKPTNPNHSLESPSTSPKKVDAGGGQWNYLSWWWLCW